MFLFILIQVSFQVYVGDNNITKVTVDIFRPTSCITVQSVECRKNSQLGLWISKEIAIPRENLCYSYTYSFTKSKRSFLSFCLPPTVKELGFRSLSPNIKQCLDLLKYPNILTPESFNQGVQCHLSVLFKSVGDQKCFHQILFELEHMWKAFDNVTLAPTYHSATANELQLWTEKKLSQTRFASNPQKSVFLCVVYGKLMDLPKSVLSHKCTLTASTKISKSDKENLLEVLKTITKGDILTRWCVSGLQKTSSELLKSLKKNHWLYTAAGFPNLFTVEDILLLRDSVGHSRIIESKVRKTIRNVIKGYGIEEAKRIFCDLPDVGEASQVKAAFLEIVASLTTDCSHGDTDVDEGPARTLPELQPAEKPGVYLVGSIF